ncbi:cytoskeleton-associated protein 2 [Chelmon rostratus]|uniref:cytoskeleton-associated protein 2 n=1 Tax=Chelmon rostratus TaxID=109905 RepID=UPI001BECF88F|nr:cytoskeleton-associated protein 2 [Chelmon rostratus]
MDIVAVSKRKHNKGNKENAQPKCGSKSFIKSATTSAAPLQLKSNKKEEIIGKHGPFKAKAKQPDTRSKSGEALKQVKPVQRERKGTAATVVKQQQTQSQAFLAEQALKDKKIATEAPKRPAAVPPSKSAPGMYKGKIVQSKIGSIWKSGATVRRPDPKPSAPKTERQRAGTVVRVTDKKVSKPPVSSTLSQYRCTMETAEERRAKLAEWLASKGKSLKRPAMTTAVPSKTKVSAKLEAGLKSQSQPAVQCNPEPEPKLEAHKPDSAAPCADTQGAELPAPSQTPVIMNTTLDLESSDADLLVDPQDRVDDVVVNLCDALEAMATPSKCDNELSQVTDVCNDVEVEDSKAKDEFKKEELKNEMPEDVGEHPKVEQVKDEVEESDDQEVEMEDKEVESDDEMEDASVVKYNVKTTPYLQSVKRTIADDASSSAHRRKSNIKDLKFLTPVRRSCRIQRKSTHLPTMLLDHDPCVSSLAELVKLDDDPNAYIYRKNPALLEDLPDQPKL